MIVFPYTRYLIYNDLPEHSVIAIIKFIIMDSQHYLSSWRHRDQIYLHQGIRMATLIINFF